MTSGVNMSSWSALPMIFPPSIFFRRNLFPANAASTVAGSIGRRTGAFQLDCDSVCQPLSVASCPLHENAGGGGRPIQIPPGRHGVGFAQLLGQGATAVTDLTHDFVPPLPPICGNRHRLMRRVDITVH